MKVKENSFQNINEVRVLYNCKQFWTEQWKMHSWTKDVSKQIRADLILRLFAIIFDSANNATKCVGIGVDS